MFGMLNFAHAIWPALGNNTMFYCMSTQFTHCVPVTHLILVCGDRCLFTKYSLIDFTLIRHIWECINKSRHELSCPIVVCSIPMKYWYFWLILTSIIQMRRIVVDWNDLSLLTMKNSIATFYINFFSSQLSDLDWDSGSLCVVARTQLFIHFRHRSNRQVIKF